VVLDHDINNQGEVVIDNQPDVPQSPVQELLVSQDLVRGHSVHETNLFEHRSHLVVAQRVSELLVDDLARFKVEDV